MLIALHPFYLLTTGHWMFGDTLCQIYGVISSLLVSMWLWLLLIASYERFVQILCFKIGFTTESDTDVAQVIAQVYANFQKLLCRITNMWAIS